MRRLLALLDTADWFVIAVACLVLGWLQLTKPAPADSAAVALMPAEAPAPPEPTLITAPADDAATSMRLGSETRILPLHLSMVDAAMAKAYDLDFSKGDYYGAFAIGTDGSYGWSSGLATPAAASTSALTQCAQVSRHCSIIGRLSPAKNAPKLTGPEANLNFSQASAYREILAGNGPRAFVRSLDGNWGGAFGKDAASATEVALKDCADHQKTFPVLPAMPCMIVAVWDK